MKPLNVTLVVLVIILTALSVTSYARWRTLHTSLVAATDSADARTTTLAAELEYAQASEAAARDTLALVRRDRASWRVLAKAEDAKNDTIIAYIATLDSAWVPKKLALAAIASLHAELALHDSIITADSVEIETLTRMYVSADSGRAALWDALQVQRGLTSAWRRAAQPSLLSWRRLKVGPGCAAGIGGAACGIAISYGF